MIGLWYNKINWGSSGIIDELIPCMNPNNIISLD